MFFTWNRYLKGHRVGKNFRHKKWVFFYDFDEIRYWLLCGHFVFFLCARRLLRLLLKTTESHRQLDRWFNVQINSAKANKGQYALNLTLLVCRNVEKYGSAHDLCTLIIMITFRRFHPFVVTDTQKPGRLIYVDHLVIFFWRLTSVNWLFCVCVCACVRAGGIPGERRIDRPNSQS